MLTIRAEQMHIFKGYAIEAFEERASRYLASEYADYLADVDSAGVKDFVRRGIAAAAECGINTEGALTVFLELQVQYGEQMQLSPDQEWAQQILTHPELPPLFKIQVIQERFSALSQGRRIVPFQMGKAAGAA
jgi:hypothetical protein